VRYSPLPYESDGYLVELLRIKNGIGSKILIIFFPGQSEKVVLEEVSRIVCHILKAKRYLPGDH